MTDNFGYKEMSRKTNPDYYKEIKEMRDNQLKQDPRIVIIQDLYSDLLELTKGEECDHPVNICWCNVFDHLRKAKEMLNKVGANI